MKSLLTLLLLLSISQQLFTQRWDHIFGNSNSNESFTDIIESYDQGYILSNYIETPQGNWIFKTDINGNILWEKILTWDNTFVYSGHIKSDKTGNLIIARTINNDEIGFWPLLVKLDSCGEKEWCRVLPQEYYLKGTYRDVITLDNGDILALGYFEAETNLDQVHLDYVDKNGNLLWRKAYAKEEDHPLIAEPSGQNLHKVKNEYVITGRCYWPYPGNPSHVYLRPMFIYIDSLFNEKWLIPFGVNDSLIGEGYDMIKLNDSVFMGVGARRMGGGVQNSLLMFLNHNGEELGHKHIPNAVIGPDILDNFIYKVERVNDSLFLTSSNFGQEDMGNPYGEFIIDTSANLHLYNTQENTEGTSQLIRTSNDEYVIGVSYRLGKTDWDILMYKINENLESVPFDTNQYTYDSLCPHPISSGIIDISDCMIWVDTDEVPTPEDYYIGLSSIPITAYPNPAKKNITFALGNTQYHQNINLKYYDIFGILKHEQKIYSGQLEAETEVTSWRKGMYVAVVRSDGKVVGKCKFVVE